MARFSVARSQLLRVQTLNPGTSAVSRAVIRAASLQWEQNRKVLVPGDGWPG